MRSCTSCNAPAPRCSTSSPSASVRASSALTDPSIGPASRQSHSTTTALSPTSKHRSSGGPCGDRTSHRGRTRHRHVVVLDTPLLKVASEHDFAAVVVVDVPIEVAVQRLVQQRGMDEADVRARMAKQPSRDERITLADRVVDNRGDEDRARRRGRRVVGVAPPTADALIPVAQTRHSSQARRW